MKLSLPVAKPEDKHLKGWYFVQDSRSYVGNCPMWWRENGQGYTSNIADAGLFTRTEAIRMQEHRETDVPWNAAYILRHLRLTLDHQDLNKRLSGVSIHGK